ncbi:MAG: hypothetical protein NXI10_03855 [bacterium]|nr:hypothetical protein [bacterium]
MKRQELKFLLGLSLFIGLLGYSYFGETDVLTSKALSGLGLLVGLGVMGERKSSDQKPEF